MTPASKNAHPSSSEASEKSACKNCRSFSNSAGSRHGWCMKLSKDVSKSHSCDKFREQKEVWYYE